MEVSPVGVELHGIVIDGGIIAHAAASPHYHLLQQRTQFLPARFRVSSQFTQVHDCTLADLAVRITPVL